MTTGRAAGIMSLKSNIQRLHDMERATLTSDGSTLWRPDKVPNSKGQKHVHHRMQIFASSPMPNRRTKSGNNENALTCPKRRNSAPTKRYERGKTPPTRSPKGIAVTIANPSPTRVRARLTAT